MKFAVQAKHMQNGLTLFFLPRWSACFWGLLLFLSGYQPKTMWILQIRALLFIVNHLDSIVFQNDANVFRTSNDKRTFNWKIFANTFNSTLFHLSHLYLFGRYLFASLSFGNSFPLPFGPLFALLLASLLGCIGQYAFSH